MMKLFSKLRESIDIVALRAVRAKYMDGPGTETIEVHLKIDGGHRLDLVIPHRLAPELIGQLTDAYEAIAPPLSRRSNMQASWDGAGNW